MRGMALMRRLEQSDMNESKSGGNGDDDDEPDQKRTLMELLSVNDRRDVLEIVVQKLVGNLQFDPAANEQVRTVSVL